MAFNSRYFIPSKIVNILQEKVNQIQVKCHEQGYSIPQAVLEFSRDACAISIQHLNDYQKREILQNQLNSLKVNDLDFLETGETKGDYGTQLLTYAKKMHTEYERTQEERAQTEERLSKKI